MNLFIITVILKELVKLVGERSAGLKLIPLSRGVCLGLPRDKVGRERALSLYQPQKLKAKGYIGIVRLMFSFGLMRLLPGRVIVGEGKAPEWLQNPDTLGVLFGNSEHRAPRMIVSYLGPKGWEVSKIVLSDDAMDLLAREASVMREAAAAGVVVPEVRGLESRDFGAMLRMSFVELEGKGCDDGQALELLGGLLLKHRMSLGDWNGWAEVAAEIGESFKSMEVGAAIRHGDFAPWNFRNSAEGVTLLDWEYGEIEGPGGMDLVHYFSQKYELVDGLSPAECVAAVLSRLREVDCESYLKAVGWAGHELDLMKLSYASVTASGQQDQGALLHEAHRQSE